MGLMLFKRAKVDLPPTPGAVYQRTMAGGVVETAKVIAITEAGFPLPHVRYVVRNEVLDPGAQGSLRTLSVESFQRLFAQRVAG